jgi:hypothetical protein
MPAIKRIVESQFLHQLIGLPLSVICRGRLIEMDKLDIFALSC